MKEKRNGWKTIAIVFILLFVIESVYFIWAYNLGSEMITNDYNCAYDICADYPSYSYDEYTKNCLCYNRDGVIMRDLIMP
jgi:hypothetical protein